MQEPSFQRHLGMMPITRENFSSCSGTVKKNRAREMTVVGTDTILTHIYADSRTERSLDVGSSGARHLTTTLNSAN